MKLKPLSDQVLIEPKKEKEITKSGFVLPDTRDRERPQQGRVVAVGPGLKNAEGKRIPLEVKVGDSILFAKFGPNEIKIEEKDFLIAKESDIMAVLIPGIKQDDKQS